MKIDVLKVGKLRCNCYILEKAGKVLVIDPGDDVHKIIEIIGDREVVGIIVTHHHFDHDGGVLELINKYNVNLYDINNLSEGINMIDEFNFDVIYTPGHKEDLITIYFKNEKKMFCGDFIFKESVGRCDLPGSNPKEMGKSIKKIMNYDRDIIIYPGHGVSTTLGYEIDNNVFFQNLEIF